MVFDELVDGELELTLAAFIPRWIADAWPFTLAPTHRPRPHLAGLADTPGQMIEQTAVRL